MSRLDETRRATDSSPGRLGAGLVEAGASEGEVWVREWDKRSRVLPAVAAGRQWFAAK